MPAISTTSLKLDGEMKERVRRLAAARRRWGYQRLRMLLKREGWTVNSKRINRIYVDNRVRPHAALGYQTPEEFRDRTGYANVESKPRFPHSHSNGGGELIPVLNSAPRTLTHPD